jgi:hypothetical protein
MASHVEHHTLSAQETRQALSGWIAADQQARYSIFRPSASADILLIQTVKDTEQSKSWAEGAEMQTWQRYGSQYDAVLAASDVVQTLDELVQEDLAYTVEIEPNASFHVEPHEELNFVDGVAVSHLFFNSLYPNRISMGNDGSVFANLFMHLKRAHSREESVRTIEYRIVRDDGKTVSQSELCELSFAPGKTDSYVGTKIAFKLNDIGSFRLEILLPGQDAPLHSHAFAAVRDERRGDPATLKELAAQRSENVGEYE